MFLTNFLFRNFWEFAWNTYCFNEFNWIELFLCVSTMRKKKFHENSSSKKNLLHFLHDQKNNVDSYFCWDFMWHTTAFSINHKWHRSIKYQISDRSKESDLLQYFVLSFQRKKSKKKTNWWTTLNDSVPSKIPKYSFFYNKFIKIIRFSVQRCFHQFEKEKFVFLSTLT